MSPERHACVMICNYKNIFLFMTDLVVIATGLISAKPKRVPAEWSTMEDNREQQSHIKSTLLAERVGKVSDGMSTTSWKCSVVKQKNKD